MIQITVILNVLISGVVVFIPKFASHQMYHIMALHRNDPPPRRPGAESWWFPQGGHQQEVEDPTYLTT